MSKFTCSFLHCTVASVFRSHSWTRSIAFSDLASLETLALAILDMFLGHLNNDGNWPLGMAYCTKFLGWLGLIRSQFLLDGSFLLFPARPTACCSIASHRMMQAVDILKNESHLWQDKRKVQANPGTFVCSQEESPKPNFVLHTVTYRSKFLVHLGPKKWFVRGAAQSTCTTIFVEFC